MSALKVSQSQNSDKDFAGADVSSFDERRAWHSQIDLDFAPSGEKTVLSRLRFFGPLRVQSLFHPDRDETAERSRTAQCYVLHPPGGLVSGDALRLRAQARPGSRALLTTPAMTKIYTADSHEVRQRESIELSADGADLEWLPQGTILYNGARAELNFEAELSGEASLCALSLVAFGRKACAEDFSSGRCVSKTRISRNGDPLVFETLRLSPGSDLLSGPFGLGGRCVMGTLWAVAPPAREEALRQAAQALMDGFAASGTGGGLAAATFRNHTAVIRYAGDSSEEGFRILSLSWRKLRPAVSARPSCDVRIWRT